MKSLANEFFTAMADGARRHQAAHAADYDLIVNGIKDERDVTRQVGLVDEMVAGGAKVLVIAPADSRALVPALKRAADAGVVVVNIDNKLDADVLAAAGLKVPFVGPDNRAGARKVGEYLAKHLAKGDPVAVLEGVQTAFNAQQRKAGFEDAVNAAGLKLVASQSAQWDLNLANTVAAAILTEHGGLKALLCGNDSMALGALAAVKAAGRDGQVKVVGFDNIPAVREAVKDGRVLATADQHGDQLAVFGIETGLDIVRGKGTPADRETPVDLVTRETLS
jgi:ribose transport system substrate-binding protein